MLKTGKIKLDWLGVGRRKEGREIGESMGTAGEEKEEIVGEWKYDPHKSLSVPLLICSNPPTIPTIASTFCPHG